MPSIADTLRHLAASRGAASLAGFAPIPGASTQTRLRPLNGFGSNPGALAAWYFVPASPAPATPRPLVVVLHGCTQTAAGYDHGAGWSDLAERFGFAVLFPEQQRANNANLCFNWFQADDIRRDGGEALSIRQMIAALVDRSPIDPARLYVTGLSAGGAMANVMLATYPELFAGGAIIAGLPYGAAASVPEALTLMRGTVPAPAAGYAALVRGASAHRGRWPRIAVWHGDADATVAWANAEAILDQWRGVHGIGGAADVADRVDGHPHRAWRGADGAVAVEDYRIAGLGHGTPLKTAGADGCGRAGAHMLEAGISSTWRQAASWGLIDPRAAAAAPAPTVAEPAAPSTPAARVPYPDGVATTIEQALKTAGLLR